MKNQLRSIVLLCAGGAILAWASFTGSRSLIISEIGIVYLVVCGVLIARHVFALHLSRALLISPLVSGLILMVSGTAVYFISALGNSECAGVLLVPGIIAIASIVTHPHSPIRSEPIQSLRKPCSLSKGIDHAFFLFYAIVTFILFGGRTEKAVLGPWDSVDPVFCRLFPGNAVFLPIDYPWHEKNGSLYPSQACLSCRQPRYSPSSFRSDSDLTPSSIKRQNGRSQVME